MIVPGSHHTLGASWDGAGVNFALYSEHATSVDLCLFSSSGELTKKYALPDCQAGVWHGYVQNCQPGQHYGYRVHGAYQPDKGLYFNPHKLLIDPYARQLSGALNWNEAVYGYDTSAPDQLQLSNIDSAPFVPKAIVQGKPQVILGKRPLIAWEDTILYELNVRGYTMRHPAVAEVDRGRFSGLAVSKVLEYIKALGVTTIELLPCHAFVDEHFLVERNLRNFWGYNSLSFFAPHTPYQRGNSIEEFKQLTNAIHDAGLEVILDVVYNHTAEGDHLGPTLSFRGIDNSTYYRHVQNDPKHYINDTGCGNTINADHPHVQKLICDSLRYWVEEMGVDGFRFDLATILGRTETGFDKHHALFKMIKRDPVISGAKLIAEPWDVGPGGYQLGNFPQGWREWNDQFRDNTRRYWTGEGHRTPMFAQSLHGSATIFEPQGRLPSSSINFITSHDGFTLSDLVSYEKRHNHANGEQNKDGHRHNHSMNFGWEGPTDDLEIQQKRRRQRLNLLASLVLSRGTPMLLAGDEFGNSQGGNNNAYAQDNETGWIDWSGLEQDHDFTEKVRQLLALRQTTRLLTLDSYPHGRTTTMMGEKDIVWLLPNGKPIAPEHWDHYQAFSMLLVDTQNTTQDAKQAIAVNLLFNSSSQRQVFKLPKIANSGDWRCEFSSDVIEAISSREIVLQSFSCACLTYARI